MQSMHKLWLKQMGVRKGVYYRLRQVRPAPHLHAKTSEFLPQS